MPANESDTTNPATPGAADIGSDTETSTMDTRAVEAQIRAVYRQLDLAARDGYRNPANWEGRNGAGVDLADLRAALPAHWPTEQVNAALGMLADHADVHLWPKSDQRNATDRDRAAAVKVGVTHHHAIAIDRQTPDASAVVERLRMRDRDSAESMVAALDDATCAEVAARMGIESGDPAVLRQRLVDTSVANLDAWRADAQQGCDDGTLLYRADTEPDWVARWTETDRQAAAEAGQRLLHRAEREPAWAYVRERATRWAEQTPDADGTAVADTAADDDVDGLDF